MALFGSDNLVAESLIAYELGYRIEPTRQLSIDVATFYNVYDDLVAFTRYSTIWVFSRRRSHSSPSATAMAMRGSMAASRL